MRRNTRDIVLNSDTTGILQPAMEVRYLEYFVAEITGPGQLIGSFYRYKTPQWRREEELTLCESFSAGGCSRDITPLSSGHNGVLLPLIVACASVMDL